MVPSVHFTKRQRQYQAQHPQGFCQRNRYDPQTFPGLPEVTLTIQLFAAAKDLAGTATLRVTLNERTTVAALRQELLKLAPALKELLPRCAIAVNHEFAADEIMLNTGDEIAVIPPVSGG